MGSYPFFGQAVSGANLVVRGRDAALLGQGVEALIAALARDGITGVLQEE